MSNLSHKLSRREKFGYSLSDASANFVFQVLIFYQQAFYESVFALPVAVLFWLLLLGRFYDAVTDPLMGIIADRTRTRWGRFRPWILWSAPLFAIVFWLAFTKPDFGPTGMLVYAIIGYLALMTVYTMNNVPYAALAGVMTPDPDQRASIQQYRFITAMAAAFIVQTFTIPWVAKFGQGDEAKGWSITIGIFAAISFVFFIITFLTTKERLEPTKPVPVREDARDIFNNKPWVILFFATLFIFVTLAFRGGPMYYFMRDYIDTATLTTFVENLGFAAPVVGELNLWQSFLNLIGLLVQPDRSNAVAVGMGVFGMAGNIVTIAGILVSTKLVHLFGKKNLFIVCLSGTTIVTASIFIVQPEQVGLFFFLSLLWPATYGPTIPVLWVMIADTADYSEWKTSRRATGFIFAGIVFALKAGLALGGAFATQIMAWHGFVAASSEQNADGLFAIRIAGTIYSAVPFAIAVYFLTRYPIGKELNLRMQSELAERRRLESTT